MSDKEIEVVDPEIEAAPEASGIVGGALGIDDQLALAENIDKLVEAQNKIRMALLRLAQPGDWVVFGEGEKKKAEIGFAGSMRVGSTLGVNFTNWTAEKEKDTDEKGQWYRWNFECDASFKNRTVRVYGRAGSRDKFFGKAHGSYKELHDVDEGNIKMAARRGAMKEGVKVLFGLHHMNPAELERYGVSLEQAQGYAFKGAEAQASESKSVTVKISEVTMKKGNNWTRYSVKDVEGVVYSTFSESFAKVAKEAKESDKSAVITFITNPKYGPEIKGIVLA